MLTFYEPMMLWLLVSLPLSGYLYRTYLSKKKKAALKFSSLGLVPQTQPLKMKMRQHMPFTLMILAAALLIIALADPHIPLKNEKEGVNLVLVIDDSGSMAAGDYPPTRLEAAKGAAAILVSSLKPKDNVGVIVFESGVTTAAYLTPDKERAIEKLKSIQQKPGQTAIGDGLSLAIDMATSIPNKKKVIVLLSDGANNAGVVSPPEAIEFAKMNKIPIHTVAMGSNQPVVIGLDFFGNPVYAQTDEAALNSIAAGTGGTFYRTVDKNTLDEVYKTIGTNIERELEDTSIKDWFLYAALATILLDIYLIYGRYRIIV